MNKQTISANITVYSFTHALIDATCATVLFSIVARAQAEPQYLVSLIVFYNVLAFATQPLFGLLTDRFDVPVHLAVLGILLVAASTLFLALPFWAILITGIGNASFHIGGGVISLDMARGKATLPGIFVAPGALGLMIGTSLGMGGRFVAWPFILLLLASMVSILRIPRPEAGAPRTLPGNLKWFETVLLLLLLSIAIRSLVGMGLVFPWKSNTTWLIILTGAVVMGKALGGILGDKFGWAKVAVSGLIISIPLLTFFAQIPALAIAGVFLFNLSMPVTLICVAQMLPGNNGFAFGLTALALIIGAWPTFTQLRVWAGHSTLIFAAILISATALYGGLRLYTEHFRNRY